MTEPIIASRDGNNNFSRPRGANSEEVREKYDQIYAKYSQILGSMDDDMTVAPAKYDAGSLPPLLPLPRAGWPREREQQRRSSPSNLPRTEKTVQTASADQIDGPDPPLSHGVSGYRSSSIARADPPEEEYQPNTKSMFSPRALGSVTTGRNQDRWSYQYKYPTNTHYYPKEYQPTMKRTLPPRPSHSVNSGRYREDFSSKYNYPTTNQHYDYDYTIPSVIAKYSTNSNEADYDDYGSYVSFPTVASRDDDGGGASSLTSYRSHHSTREDIHSKINALNAKSRALRGIAYSLSSSAPDDMPSSYNPTSSFSQSSPTSVMSPPSTSLLGGDKKYKSPFLSENNSVASVMGGNKHDGSFLKESNISTSIETAPSSPLVLGGKYSKTISESADSRLELLTKQSLELRKRADATSAGGGGAVAVPLSNNNKRVTFEADYINGANIGMDNRGFYGIGEMSNAYNNEIYPGGVNKKEYNVNPINNANRAPSGTATTKSGATSLTSTASQASGSGDNGAVNNITANRTTIHAVNAHPSNSLAMKILSEKILDGYTMTRKHCPNCNMALLCRDVTYKNSISFNSDGSLNMASLSNLRPKEECVFCPVNELRKSISRGVCKRVMAVKLLTGFEVGTASGRSLCDICQSPTLLGKDSKTMECQVCPVLDAICIEIVKEQGQGGTVREFQACLECGSPKIEQSGGVMKCVVCDVLKVRFQEKYNPLGALFTAADKAISSSRSVAAMAVVAAPSPLVGMSPSSLPRPSYLVPGPTDASDMSDAGSLPQAPISIVKNSMLSSSSVARTMAVSVTSDASSLPQSSTLVVGGNYLTQPPSSVAGTTSVSLMTDSSFMPQETTLASQPLGGAKSPSQLLNLSKSASHRPDLATSPPILTNENPPVASSPPPIESSTPIKSDDHTVLDRGNIENIQKIDFVKLQEHLVKAKTSQESLSLQSLELPMLSCQPIEKVKIACNPILDEEIVKSPSIKSGNSSPADGLAKLQDQLKVAVADNLPVKSESDNVSPSMDLGTLQNQLKAELLKAKESQTILEASIQRSSNVAAASTKSREELQVELETTKQTQTALEKIIEDTANIEKTATDNTTKPDIPDRANTDEVHAAAITSPNPSYSISQQEVDATGHLKEYIPPPSYFSPNIPTEVLVYHIPEVEGGDQSVAAQSHHTKNLKRSERYVQPKNSSCFGCCCDTTANKDYDHNQHTDYDFDTIETDDAYTVDCTLNTMDDSRLDRLRERHEDDRSRVNGGEEKEKEKRDFESMSRGQPQSSLGKCLFSCFGCCGNSEGDDAYSMVSRRGIKVEQQQREQRQSHLSGSMDLQYEQKRENLHHREDSGERYTVNPSVGEDSDISSMCRVGESIPKRLNRRNGSSDTRATLHHGKHSIDGSEPHLGDSDYESGGIVAKTQLQHTAIPSLQGTPDWGSANESPNDGSDFGSMRHDSGSQPAPPDSKPKPLPQPSLASARPLPTPILPPPRFATDHNSVQSDLTDHSSVNHRRVTFGSSSRGDRNKATEQQLQHQQELRALTEEEGLSTDNFANESAGGLLS